MFSLVNAIFRVCTTVKATTSFIVVPATCP